MNRFYSKGLDKFCTADIDWVNDDIKVSLVILSKYPIDTDADEFYSVIPTDAIISDASITSRVTTGDGAMDAVDTTLPGVVNATPGDAYIIWKDTGVASASPLIAVLDDVQGLPILSSGQVIPITWSNNGNKILSLRDSA